MTPHIRHSAAFVIVAMVASVGCGAGFTDKANSTLATSLAATNAARDQFVAWDKAHQKELVDQAATRDAAEGALKSYRAKRGPVLKAFTAVYTAIATAAAAIPLVDKGIKHETDLVPLLSDVAAAALVVKEAYGAITKGP